MTTYAVTSEVLEVATIVQVVVDDAALGDWTPEPGTGFQRRTGTVTVRLADVLKGRITEPVGTSVTVDVVLRGTGSPRLGDVEGVWSHVPTDAGARLVAFCDAGTRTLALALSEQHYRRLTESGPVLADLRLAIGLQRRSPTADRLLAEAERQRAAGGAVFARYVWVAAREALRASLDRFDRLMLVAEDPATRVEAQETYLVSAYEDVTFTGAYPAEHRARLARAMLASTLDPRLGELRTTLLGVYVPNLLATAAPGPLTADDVFGAGPGPAAGAVAGAAPGPAAPGPAAAPDLRDALRVELDDPRDPATTSPALRAWLDGSDPTDGEG